MSINTTTTWNKSLTSPYQTGTWAPTYLQFGGADPTSLVYTSDGRWSYISTGKSSALVTCTFSMHVTTASGGSGNFAIGGLPFNALTGGISLQRLSGINIVHHATLPDIDKYYNIFAFDLNAAQNNLLNLLTTTYSIAAGFNNPPFQMTLAEVTGSTDIYGTFTYFADIP